MTTSSSPRIPVRLQRDTIFSFTFEVRFQLRQAGAGDLLPGLLTRDLADLFPNYQRLASPALPAQLRSRDPTLTYAPSHQLGHGNRFLLLGERVAMVTITQPYPGWSDVALTIGKVLKALADTDTVSVIERASLRYANMLPPDQSRRGLEALQVQLALDGLQLSPNGLHIRAEIPDGQFLSIVQILPTAQVRTLVTDEVLEGLLLDVDTIVSAGPKWTTRSVLEVLDDLHAAEKRIFFSLLKPETLEALGPVWNTQPTTT